MIMEFRLDRSDFHAGTHDETERYHARHQPETMADRLRAVAYLNSVAFNYDLNNPPRLDRTVFSARGHSSLNGSNNSELYGVGGLRNYSVNN
jgi:hypothetical protein